MEVNVEKIFWEVAMVFTALAVCTIALFKWKYSYWERRGVPSIKPTIPFGNISKVLTKKLHLGERLREIYEEIRARGLKHAGVYMFLRETYVPVDPEIIRSIMQKDFQHFMNHGLYVNEQIDPINAHLFTLEDAKWKNLRQKLTPTFTSGKMKMMFSTMANCAQGLQKIMEDGHQKRTSVNVKEILSRFTTDIIGSAAFGLNCKCLQDEDAEFRNYGRRLAQPAFWVALKGQLMFMVPKNIMSLLRMKLIEPDVEEFFKRVVRDTVNYREMNNIARKDFMHLLLQLKNRGKVADDENIKADDGEGKEQALTMNELTAQVVLFFVAGFETSATTMTFALYELATNPDIQEKLRKEINNVLNQNGGELTYEAIMQMTYLEMVINESLRKYPPVPVLTRKCNADYVIPGTNICIENGTFVAIPIWGIQNDPEYYPNPEKFQPERFTEENKKSRPPCTWMPFGEGPRQCIGLRFGLMQAKVGLATLLRNYKVTLDTKKTRLPLEYNKHTFIISSVGGMWLNVEKVD